MNSQIREVISKILKELKLPEVEFVVEHPQDFSHGDFSTNVAMAIAGKEGGNPREWAEKIKESLEEQNIEGVEKIEIAGPGFINFRLTRNYFSKEVERALGEKDYGQENLFDGQKVVVEYTQPNILKPFHIGHLMSNAIGESVSRILEFTGADVKRVNYQGDVGLHIAKALWGMEQLGDEMPAEDDSLAKKTEFLGNAYVHGSSSYEELPEVKEEIDEINIKLYKGGDEKLHNLYEVGRRWSLEHLDEIYKTLGTKFDRLYFESETAPIGESIVKENIDKVFEKSDGAVVYRGEKEGLHTRVFISSKGIPTYEAKELALPGMKYDDFKYDKSIVITAEEQKEYFKVVMAALAQIDPELSDKQIHITHGMMQLTSGKMSSRKGNVVTGESLLRETIVRVEEVMKDRSELSAEEKKEVAKQVAVSAIKYSVLRQSSGKNIIYDEEKALSFEGDSGPYLQYTYARIKALLEKASGEGITPSVKDVPDNTYEVEKLLPRFEEVVERAAREYEPHYITTYLTELTGSFNSFYGEERIVDKEGKNSPYKLAVSEAVSVILGKGLHLLGIETPERM